MGGGNLGAHNPYSPNFRHPVAAKVANYMSDAKKISRCISDMDHPKFISNTLEAMGLMNLNSDTILITTG